MKRAGTGPEEERATRVLFVCSRNKLRSPTAERVFAEWPGIEAASAGLNRDADVTMTAELVAWADIIFVMERGHGERLRRRFGAQLRGQRIVCLEIPDQYTFMDEALVARLRAAVPRYLR